MMESNLDKYLHTVRRIEEHREENAVKELQKLYKQLIKDLRSYMGNAYADYSDPETGKLTFADLHAKGLDARLLEEVAARMNEVTQKEKSLIKETVEEIYRETYSGMVNAVDQAANSDDLHEELSTLQSIKPETVSAAVNNPVHGLTLTDQLEKHREEIVYGIKQAVGVGLSVGDNYTTMAKRIQTTLIGPDGAGGSYAKSVRIARTEAHRVRETGNLDAAQNLTEKLENAGYTMTKTWHTMKDERVRPQRRYKTKSGWKTGKPGKYNHVKMDGVTVPINEKFKLPSGAETMAPGQSGVAGEDINCRCYLSYAVVRSLSAPGADDKISITGDRDALDLQFFAERDINRQSSKSLRNGIKSYGKKIAEHERYIKNPESHCSDWNEKDPREQAGLIRHWNKEIENFKNAIKAREDELKKRGDTNEK